MKSSGYSVYLFNIIVMRNIFVIVIALALAGCGEDTITHTSGESREMVLIAVNESGEIFMSTSKSSLSIDELSERVSDLVNDGTSYSFIIQSDESSGSHVKEVEELLYNSGAEKRHVAISHSQP